MSTRFIQGTPVNYQGRTDGTVTPSGFLGETLQGQQFSNTSMFGNGVWGDVASVTLTPGRWSITGFVVFILNGSTTSSISAGISTTAGNSASGLTGGDNQTDGIPPTASVNSSITIPNYIVQITTNTTYYLKAVTGYSAGTPQHRGRITAIRIA